MFDYAPDYRVVAKTEIDFTDWELPGFEAQDGVREAADKAEQALRTVHQALEALKRCEPDRTSVAESLNITLRDIFSNVALDVDRWPEHLDNDCRTEENAGIFVSLFNVDFHGVQISWDLAKLLAKNFDDGLCDRATLTALRNAIDRILEQEAEESS